MSDANRTRMTVVAEATLGTTPNTPRMRTARVTNPDTLTYAPVFAMSQELRDDRMDSDPTKVNETNGGTVTGELSYPVPDSPLSIWFESLMGSVWVNTPTRDNDGTADSIITGVAASNDTYTVASGDAFVLGQLVRATGFTNSGNNGLFRAQSGSGATSVIAPSSPGLTDESAPPGTARLKVVGFEGASGDITALADGLGSTALDFTTLGLVPGQWIKIGGTADASTFAFLVSAGAVSRRQAWARVSGTITATKIPLDNLPSGWTADSGTSKTIQCFYGDQIKNGVLKKGCTIERGYMGQTVPSYIKQWGMLVGQAQFNFTTERQVDWSFTFTGMGGSLSTTSLDASPDAPTTNAVMAAAVNVGRIAENGTCIGAPNWLQSLQINVNNNLRPKNALDCDETIGPVDIGLGSFNVTINAPRYFGSDAALTSLFSGTPSNLNTRLTKNNQAVIFAIPRYTQTDGSPTGGGKNTDVMIPIQGSASKDELTSAHLIVDRFEYFA